MESVTVRKRLSEVFFQLLIQQHHFISNTITTRNGEGVDAHSGHQSMCYIEAAFT